MVATMEGLDIEKLATLIAKKTSIQPMFITSAEVARMCGYASKSHALYELMKDPKFPRPVSLVGDGHPRYSYEAVKAYLAKKATEFDPLYAGV